eukprot:gene10120-13603_t
MRLTADILLRAETYINAYKDREINLRGFKIPAIENLAILQDQFDVIDFSDNEIKKLDGFPSMRRLNAIILNNNHISRVGDIGEHIPSITCLILTNNRITNLSEIDKIASLKKLEILSLLENPIMVKNNYRLYTIFKIPSLKLLDFRKITSKERKEAVELFASSEGTSLLSEISHEGKLLENGSSTIQTNSNNSKAPNMVLTDEQKQQVKAAIEAATTREQIDVIERQLKTGSFAFAPVVTKSVIVDTPQQNDTNDSNVTAENGSDAQKNGSNENSQMEVEK